MRVCLVSYTAPYTIPYINLYLDQVKAAGTECDVLYWDRDCTDVEHRDGNVRYLPYSGKSSRSFGKLARYFRYVPATNFIRRHLVNNNYDRVVFLQTHAAVACEKILAERYLGRYIVDIRDFTLENLKPFFNAERRVIEESFHTVISSDGYRSFLPEYDYMVVHNYTPVASDIAEKIRSKPVKTSGINLSFIGYVRFYDMAKRIILALKNDERFRISFIGTGSEALESFCSEHDVRNVTLKGRFSPEDTAEYYLDCDIINNLYGSHSRYLDYALSNKLYYGAQFGIPVLVSADTYSSYIAEQNGIGFTWDATVPDAADRLYDAYINFDRNRARVGSVDFLRSVKRDNLRFKRMLVEFFEGDSRAREA